MSAVYTVVHTESAFDVVNILPERGSGGESG